MVVAGLPRLPALVDVCLERREIREGEPDAWMVENADQRSTSRWSISHRSISHRSTSHWSTSHWSTSHWSTSHWSTAHRSISHRSTSHWSTAHRSTSHWSASRWGAFHKGISHRFATASAEYQADSDRCKNLFFQRKSHFIQKKKVSVRMIFPSCQKGKIIFPEGISNGNRCGVDTCAVIFGRHL
ncbi:hypothetical protein CPter91_4740 [Collimonas pratensis]|uniref:Uncharacterized protein n=1 Tax=Collimonas pratensis TaxID=279113 RepID=A0A127QAE5_9BURK|nr:hypothetical protein CPter91_4740 [Collimonas pratensis]